jgi:hypothetical protein
LIVEHRLASEAFDEGDEVLYALHWYEETPFPLRVVPYLDQNGFNLFPGFGFPVYPGTRYAKEILVYIEYGAVEGKGDPVCTSFD